MFSRAPETMVNRAAGMATWKTNRPSTASACAPSRPLRPTTYPIAVSIQMGAKAESRACMPAMILAPLCASRAGVRREARR